MADVKISELTALTSPDGAEELVVNDGGTTKKITITNATSASLSKTGGTMTGDTFHGDNVSSRFGAGNDLSINHTGSYSSIVDSGTGDLWIGADANVNIANAALNEYKAQFISNGAVNLYYDNAVKIGTTSAGVAITGGGTMTGALFIASPNQATGGSSLQLRQGNNTAYGIDMGVSQTTGSLNISKVNNGTSTPMMTLRRDNGNVGIGNTVEPYNNLHVESSTPGISLVQTGAGGAYLSYASAKYTIGMDSSGSNGIYFRTYSGGYADRLTIKSDGTLYTNGISAAPSASVHGLAYIASSNGYLSNSVDATTGATHIQFWNSNGICGQIYTSGSSTTYATSSDYRLKTDVQPMTGATARVKLLKPCNFEWIEDGTRVDGFLAHETQEVVPEAVTGTKDAMMDEEYEVSPATGDVFTSASDSSESLEVVHNTYVEKPETLEGFQQWRETTAAVMGTRSVPDMQGIDQSKLVPLLTATIQELIARIEALEA